MKVTSIVLVIALAALAAPAVQADSHERVVALWHCTVNEGKSMEDVETANSKWVKLMNESVEGGDIHSFILTPVVGKQGGFMYADSFPSMVAWAASREAMETEAGQAIEAELEEVADCSSNTLHESTKS